MAIAYRNVARLSQIRPVYRFTPSAKQNSGQICRPVIRLDVVPAPHVLTSIVVTPVNPTVAIGNTVQLYAFGYYLDGTTANITTSVAWTSGTPGNATVGASTGIVTGVANGTSLVQASLTFITGSTTVNSVTKILEAVFVDPTSPSVITGQTTQCYATGFYNDFSTSDITTSATWNSVTPGNITVGASTGLLTGVAPGTSLIQATLSGITGSQTATDVAKSVETVVVTPTAPSVITGQTFQCTATAFYNDGSVADVTSSASWTSGTHAHITVGAGTGLLTGVAPGTSLIQATYSSIASANVTATDVAKTLVDVVVDPTAPTVVTGTTFQLSATAYYNDGSFTDVTSSAAWTSGTPGHITVGAGTGLLTGVATGTSLIQATFNSVSGTVTATDVAKSLEVIFVDPTSPTVITGQTTQMYATGFYNDNSVADVTTAATWTSGTGAHITVGASTGVITGVATGTSLITATIGGVSGSQTATDVAKTLEDVVVTPTAPSVITGLTTQCYATGYYNDNSTADLTSSAAWTSGTPGHITVGAGTGLLTGVAPGTSLIQATVSAVTGSVTATDVAKTLISIVVSPINQDTYVGSTQQYTATGFYSDDTNSNITSSVTWSSSNHPVATISSGGLLTGVSTGSSTIEAILGSINNSTTATIVSAPPSGTGLPFDLDYPFT